MNTQKLSIVLLSALLFSCGQKEQSNSANDNKPDSLTVQTAKEAYIFGLPLVLMDITRRLSLNAAANPMAAAENSFSHVSVFPDANFRAVVRPNADTYYSSAMLNLEKEPIILSVPDTKDRYYMMPMMDAYTNVFSSPGKRTTGTAAGDFLISGPNWAGESPPNFKQIKAPTNLVWIIGRTQVNSKADGDNVVVPLQKKYKLTPLSSWGNMYEPPDLKSDSTVSGEPNELVKNMPIDSFFNYVNRLMIVNPPAEADKPALDKFASIGVGPGKTFSLTSLNEPTQSALKAIPTETFDLANNFFNQNASPGGWSVNTKLGSYGTDYLTRAFVSIAGLGANLPEDAIYPSTQLDADGNKLTGANKYVLHFEKGKTPPANAFWSLTMYDNDGYMIANPINRHAIGDRSRLKTNPDGSLDIYIQHTSPGKDKDTNWLPAPEGEFNILMRVYWPKEEMIDGTWKVPAVQKAK